MIKKYGKIRNEEKLEQSIAARDITKTIMDYGVSQYQILKIIYLLSLELENREISDDLVTIVNSILKQENSDSDQKENEIIVR